MENMTAAELQGTFELSSGAWERISTAPGMIEPIDPEYTDGVTKWPAQGFARWLARRHPELSGAVPALLRPAPDTKPDYLGGRYAASDEVGHDREHFAGLWRTGAGVVAVVYPRGHVRTPRDLLEFHADAVTVVVVQTQYDLYGPALEAVDRDRPELPYEPRWSEIAAHIGTQVPWWPVELRRPEHLLGWRPGDRPAPVDVVTSPSWEPLYELARAEPEGSAVRGACFTIGHEIRTRSAESAEHEVTGILEKRARHPRTAAERAAMVLPAVPATEDPGRSETVPADVVARGLAELCARTDDEAVECLEQISMWSGEHFPFGGVFSIVRSRVTREAAEWINRLRRVSPTAIHRLWTRDGATPVGAFVDPVTGSPVVAFKGRFGSRDRREISYLGSAPKRLPAGSVLKEVVLDDPIWVRTTDGVLYPAPSMDAPGLSWGYRGSGPRTLATCVGRLLDDGSAHAVTYGTDRDDEPGLTAYFTLGHKPGTRIPRRRLEAARASATPDPTL
ncbi:hypothetical protein [Streptomyces sp. NPDC127190]|uniref:hypothetical protein n=1 Tax=unclassified Streptomyces TaxID=2593676 RepID=UPI00363C3CCC